MRKEGVLLVCDRCGKAVLLEQKGEDYTYEPAPEGWSEALGHELCDTCSRNLEGVFEKFWNDSRRKAVHF